MRSIQPVGCDQCPNRDDAVPCLFPSDIRARVSLAAFTTMYPSGAVLFGEGAPSRYAFILCSGRVKHTANSAAGRSILARISEAGEILGLGSILSGGRHPYTAETLAPSQVTSLRREDFLRLVKEFPPLGEIALGQLSGEIDQAADKIRSIGLAESAGERLVTLLLSLAERHGTPTPSGTRIMLALTHETIAQMIGVSRETVSRAMTRFRNAGVIELRKSTIVIRDPAALQHLGTHRLTPSPKQPHRQGLGEVSHEDARPS